MSNIPSIISADLCVGGTLFFVAGAVGLLRFPDVYSRLHALTKADNVGLGMIALGIAIGAGSPWVAIKVVLIWLLALVASATACNLIAGAALEAGIRPWEP